MNLKNLFIRTIAGAVYVAIVLLGILFGKYAFMIVFGLLLTMGLHEYYKMVEKKDQLKLFKPFNLLFGVASVASILFFPQITLILVVVYLLIQFISTLYLNKPNDILSAAYSVFGQFYITLPFVLLSLINIENGQNGSKIILAIFIFIWVNDTAAFLVGSLLGKHKLFERISPKKTIEGFIGGVVLATSAAFVFNYLVPDFNLIFWIIFGMICSITGTLGDLFESLIKRTYNIKDSGNLIPGHGGILDRIDSLLFAIPSIYIYLQIIQMI